MDATAIAERLKTHIGDALTSVVTDTPDPYLVVAREQLVSACKFLRDEPGLMFDYLPCLTAVDLNDKILMVYHLWSLTHRHGIVVKVELDPSDLVVPSLTALWPAANWHEREQYDLLGVTFSEHPDLRRIMLPEDWVGHPLRKNYVYPTSYHGISHDRPSPHEQFKALDAKNAPPPAKAPLPPAEPPVA